MGISVNPIKKKLIIGSGVPVVMVTKKDMVTAHQGSQSIIHVIPARIRFLFLNFTYLVIMNKPIDIERMTKIELRIPFAFSIVDKNNI
jgi:hypothetical protein